ncbi:hypothetical protein CRH09_19485 [Nocardia terpenica]|uniref:histidine kinase n=2 Tax=Nocardia terpenica TaxID=455432 RepID=A0A291RKE3_9NOCA|nr:hypothetical protein CRH09_19485 [Nocardia terpenica]
MITTHRLARAYGSAMTLAAVRRRLTWWGGSPVAIVLDLAIAVVFGLLTVEMAHTSSIGVVPEPLAPVVAGVVGVGLFVRRRFPLAALAAAMFGYIASGGVYAIAVAVATVAWRFGNVRTTRLATAVTAVVVFVPWGLPITGDRFQIAVFVEATLVVLPAVFGLWLAQRRQLVDSLRERAEQAERERDLLARSAVVAERARIAREMHDVVAHRISQMTVLAGAVQVSTEGQAAEAAAAIRNAGTAALAELREMLGVLRGDQDVPLRPTPTLDELRELVDEAVAAGQRVTASIPGELPEVSGSAGRAAYRLVQESLTNAAKHAPGQLVSVLVDTDGPALRVTVRNDLGRPADHADTGGGLGIIGMRERVALAHGTLRITPDDDGQFVVTATFPLPEDEDLRPVREDM